MKTNTFSFSTLGFFLFSSMYVNPSDLKCKKIKFSKDVLSYFITENVQTVNDNMKINPRLFAI